MDIICILCFFLASEVIMQEIEMQSETGQKAQEILLRGEAIPEDMAAKMVEAKINSPEVAHHGNKNFFLYLNKYFICLFGTDYDM